MWCPVKGAPAPCIAWRRDDVAVQNSTSIAFQLKASNFGKQRELQMRGEKKRRDYWKGTSASKLKVRYHCFVEVYQYFFKAYFDCLNLYKKECDLKII